MHSITDNVISFPAGHVGHRVDHPVDHGVDHGVDRRIDHAALPHPAVTPVGATATPPNAARALAPRGVANAFEVSAAAGVVERLAPHVTVRAVAKRPGVYVVKAVERRAGGFGARTHVYRLPADMVEAALARPCAA